MLRGEPVALPTETVYGLAGRIDSEKALRKIFALKRRPLFDPLIVHCRSRSQIREYILGGCPLAESLWERFSPGPLTVVAPKNKKISDLITAHQPSAAIRIPAHPIMQKLLRRLPAPLAAPSANLFGKASPSAAAHVAAAFEGKVPVLDGGDCQWGLESTIAAPDMRGKKLLILRPGAVTREDLELFLKEKFPDFSLIETSGPRGAGSETGFPKGAGKYPGGWKSHYAPDIPLIIVESGKSDREIRRFLRRALNKAPKAAGRSARLKRLSLGEDPLPAARRLYSDLRELSQQLEPGRESFIYVQKAAAQNGGLWTAVWDRLEKAASKKFSLPAKKIS